MGTEGSSKDHLAERAYALAYDYERRHHNCPQCVFAALQEVLGIGDDATFKAAYSLSGGGARTSRGTCGALVGGMLAIGSIYGRDKQHFGQRGYSDASRVAKKLFDRFVEEWGSPICTDVHLKWLGRRFDMWTEYEAFDAAGAHDDKCPTVTGKTARWAVEILLEEMGEAGK